MRKEILNTSKSIWEKILYISLLIYLFFLIFPHITTLREVAFWTAITCWLILQLRKPNSFLNLLHIRTLSNKVDSILISLFLFMVIAFISSVMGIEPLENLKRFKGELLIPFLLFLVTATEFNNIEKVKGLVFAPLIAFAVYTLLSICESTNYGLRYFWDKTYREQYIWLKGYSRISALTFPLTLGLIILVTKRWLKYFLISFAVIEFAILTAYRGFSVFLGAISVLLLWVLFVRPKKYKLWMAAFLLLFLFVSALLLHIQKDNPAIAEYRSKLKVITNIPEEMKSEGGFSNRMPVWSAAIDIIKDRPLLGYGWGMKKFTKLVQDKKFLESWKANKPHIYNFFSISYRNIFFPPHNMFLEIAIQSGLLGLASFIAFVGIYIFYIIRKAIYMESDTDYNFAIILISGTFLSFMIANLMSNELGNAGGKILFAVLGTGVAWLRGKKLKHSAHSFE